MPVDIQSYLMKPGAFDQIDLAGIHSRPKMIFVVRLKNPRRDFNWSSRIGVTERVIKIGWQVPAKGHVFGANSAVSIKRWGLPVIFNGEDQHIVINKPSFWNALFNWVVACRTIDHRVLVVDPHIRPQALFRVVAADRVAFKHGRPLPISDTNIDNGRGQYGERKAKFYGPVPADLPPSAYIIDGGMIGGGYVALFLSGWLIICRRCWIVAGIRNCSAS